MPLFQFRSVILEMHIEERLDAIGKRNSPIWAEARRFANSQRYSVLLVEADDVESARAMVDVALTAAFESAGYQRPESIRLELMR